MDLAALKSCLDSLKYLAIDIVRLKEEPGYDAKGGGHGDVRVCMLDSDTQESKLVAAKTIRLRGRHKEPQRLAFRLARELKVWAGLRHPHILPLLGYYLDKDFKVAVLISEYQCNGDLTDYLDQEKPSWSIRLQLTRDSADGLAYLHGQNPPIRHGDLKPGNVLINAERQAMLADFGLSKSLEDGPTGLTTSDGLKGTLRYYSPELVTNPEANRYLPSDIWAWACLALEVLSDKIPYAEKKSEHTILLALMGGEPPSKIEELLISFPDLKSLLAMCWTLEPNERPSAVDCLRVLNSALSVPLTEKRIESTAVQYDFLQQKFGSDGLKLAGGSEAGPNIGASVTSPLPRLAPGGSPMASTSHPNATIPTRPMSAPSFPVGQASSHNQLPPSSAGGGSMGVGPSMAGFDHHHPAIVAGQATPSYDFAGPTILSQLRDMEKNVKFPPSATIDPTAFLTQPPMIAASSSSPFAGNNSPYNPNSLMAPMSFFESKPLPTVLQLVVPSPPAMQTSGRSPPISHPGGGSSPCSGSVPRLSSADTSVIPSGLSPVASSTLPTVRHYSAASLSPEWQVSATGVALDEVISTRHGSQVTVGAIVASVFDDVVQMASQGRDAYLAGKQDKTHALIEELLEGLKFVGGLGVGPSIGPISSNMSHIESQDDGLMQAPASTSLEGSSPSSASNYRSGSLPKQAQFAGSANNRLGSNASAPQRMNQPLPIGSSSQAVTATAVGSVK